MSGLEIIGFILGTTGPIQQLIQLINAFKQNYQAYKTNPQLMENMLQSLEQHSSSLQQLSTQLHQHKSHIPDENQDFIDRSLSQVKQVLENTLDKLKEMEKTVAESKLLRHIKALRNSTTCHTMMEELRESHEKLENINALMINICSNISITTEQTDQIVQDLTIVKTNQEQIRNQMNIGSCSDSHSPDQFLPQRQSLQYSHAAKINFDEKDKDGKFVSVEGKIKHELLEPCHPGQNVLAIQGEAGVGKTTTLGMLTQNGDIVRHFTDGVYCMKLGADANTKTVMEEIVKIVKACGGNCLSEEMHQIDNIYKVMDKSCSWFREKQILLAIDDIWDKDGSGVEIVQHLSRLVRSGRNAAMVYTTRDPKVAQIPTFRISRKRDPFSTECRSILMRHCQCDKDVLYDEETEEAITYLLKICHGLPAVHGVVGKAVREYALSCRSGTTGGLKWYKHTHGSIVESKGDEYGNLHSVFMTALKILDEEDKEDKKGASNKVRNGKDRYSYYMMHRGLCVLEKQQRGPMSMLGCLWSMEGEDDMKTVKKICERFVRVGLAEWNHTTRTTRTKRTKRMNHRRNKNNGDHNSNDNDGNEIIECISIHDLLHDFAINEAKKNREIEEWHDRVIEGYKKRHKIRMNENEGCEEWWQVEKKNEDRDGYCLKNVCRHMRSSKTRREEVVKLVTRPKWIGVQVCNNGIVQYGEDMKCATECIDNNTEEIAECEDELEDERRHNDFSIKDMKWIGEAVRLSAIYIQQNRSETWFQIYDRLMVKANESSWVKRYLFYIEKNAPRPWLRSMQPCLIGVGNDSIPIGNSTFSMVVLRGEEEVACGCKNGDIVIINIKKKRIMTAWHAHEDRIVDIKVSEDGKYLISGSKDNTAKVWNIETFGLKSVLEGHTDQIRAIWIGNGGRTAFTASWDGTVREWNVEKGEQIGEYRSDGEQIWYLEVLEDGKVIIFLGKYGRKIYRWKIENEEDSRRNSLWTRKFIKHNKKKVVKSNIVAFGISKDETKLAIVTAGPNVSIWSTKTMNRIQIIDATNYDGKRLWRIALNNDGTILACGSNEGDIIIYDLNNGRLIRESLNGGFIITGLEFINAGSEIVLCTSSGMIKSWKITDMSSQVLVSIPDQNRQNCWSVAVTPDGSHFVTGHRRGILRIWDASNSSLKRQSEKICDSDLWAVTVSPDGKRVFCGCSDGKIQVVDTNTTQRITTLEGHNKLINCNDITRDGNHLVTGSFDNTIRIWDANRCDGNHIAINVGEEAWRVFVSDDGRRIVCIVSPGVSMQIWDIEKKECIRRKKIDTHNISRKEAMILADEIEEDETKNPTNVYHDFRSYEIRYGSFDNYQVLGTLEFEVREWEYEMRHQIMSVASRSETNLFFKVEGELEKNCELRN